MLHLYCTPFLQRARYLLSILFLVVPSFYCFGQYNPVFDSSLRAAIAIDNPGKRLAALTPLIEESNATSTLQNISFGNALLNAAREAGHDTDLYKAHNELCLAYQRSSDFEQSIKHGLEAAVNAEKRKDYPDQVTSLAYVGITYAGMARMSNNKADVEKSFYYCHKALQIAKTQNLKTEIPFLLMSSGNIYAMDNQYDTAISFYRQAIDYLEKHRKNGSMQMYINMGIALTLKKDYDAALAAYRRADSIVVRQKMGDPYRLSIAINQAILYGYMGRFQESEQSARKILATARQSGAVSIEADMLDHLKDIFRKQGRYQEALDFADSLAAVKARILNTEKTSQVAEMQARYDAGVKDQQIAGQQLTIRQNKRQNMILLGGIGLVCIVGAVAFAGWRRSSRLNREITIQRQQLVEQKTELQQMNEVKDQLFSVIGHDLRTPINSLISYATLLDEVGDLPPEKTKQYSADLRQALGYVAVLMENLLQFAKTQMQATQPYAEMISLSDVATHTARLLQPAMASKNISLITDFAEDGDAYADEDMTELILRNLISNAVKFSAANGHITIMIKPHDDQFICCTVQDQGTGMNPELVAIWNDPGGASPMRSTKGTRHEKGAGIGLMLSKRFAGIMGGQLLVESEQGKGSAFSLLLPRSSPLA